MKKLLIATALLAVTLLCGCTKVESVDKNDKQTSMFVLVEQTASWGVVYHKDTKVMYVVSCGGYNGGNFTLLVNPDGSPMIYGAESG